MLVGGLCIRTAGVPNGRLSTFLYRCNCMQNYGTPEYDAYDCSGLVYHELSLHFSKFVRIGIILIYLSAQSDNFKLMWPKATFFSTTCTMTDSRVNEADTLVISSDPLHVGNIGL